DVDASGLVPACANIWGRSDCAGSLPIEAGGPSCDSAGPTRRGRIRVADIRAGVAESPAACAGVVRGSGEVLTGGADLLDDCLDVPLRCAVDIDGFAAVIAGSADSSAGCRAL